MNERRACKAISSCRMTVRYNSTRPDDGVPRERVRMIARERRRFGYRRMLVLLRREGHVLNHKKFSGLYSEEKLVVRRRCDRKRSIGMPTLLVNPLAPKECWALDIVLGQVTDGRRFRILTVVDTCRRDC